MNQNINWYSDLPASCGILVGRYDDNFHSYGGAEQVYHLLVWKCCHSHLANFNQPATLSQPRLPGIAIWLYLCHDAFVVNVKSKLAQAVPPQGHLRGLTAFSEVLREKSKIKDWVTL